MCILVLIVSINCVRAGQPGLQLRLLRHMIPAAY